MTKPRSIYAEKLNEFSAFAFGGERVFQQRGDWRHFFRERIGPAFNGQVIFEVGCFDAAYLCRLAAKHPETAFIGLDWKFKALYGGAERAAAMGLENVALLRGRAQDIRQIFADGEIDEIWIFHPDPCDRPVELPNRLVSEAFLVDAHAVLADVGSRLCLKTDHPGYYQWVLGLLSLPEPAWFTSARRGSPLPSGPAPVTPKLRIRDLMRPENVPPVSIAVLERFEVAANAADFWQDQGVLNQTASRLFADELTFFETRFVKKRQPIYYIELRKR